MAFSIDDLHSMIDAAAAAGQPDAGETPDVEVPSGQPQEEAPAQDTPQPDPTVVSTPDVQPAEQGDKDANAFAQMRAQNKMYRDLLGKLADANGIQFKSDDEMLNALNGDALGKIAERKGIPVEFLQRMEALEANSKAWEQQQTQQRLQAGFQTLQTKYGLDQTQLMTFAQQLDNSGVNLAQVDVEKEYVASHMEDIISARVSAAVQAALAKDANINAQASVPGAPGASAAGPDETKIKSVADLRSFLNGLSS